MPRRRTVPIVVLLAVGAALGGFLISPAGARPGAHGGAGSTLLIRHQRVHCHAWSLNGGPFRAAQRVGLRSGARLTVVDMDVMPHRLMQLSGPRVSMRNGSAMGMMGGYGSGRPGSMNHMGASTSMRFARPGIYRFRTRAGEDYMAGVRTTGEDNVLTLIVTVR